MIKEPEVVLWGWLDQDDSLWRDKENADAYFGEQPYSLRPLYAVVVDEEEERFNGY